MQLPDIPIQLAFVKIFDRWDDANVEPSPFEGDYRVSGKKYWCFIDFNGNSFFSPFFDWNTQLFSVKLGKLVNAP